MTPTSNSSDSPTGSAEPDDANPDDNPSGDMPGKDLSPSTQRVYRAGWRDFVGWCQGRGQPPLPAPPELVADFLKDRSEMALSTIRNRISAIKHYHEVSGLEDPTSSLVVSDLWHKISEKKRGAEGPRPKSERFAPGEMLREGDKLLSEYFGQIAGENEELSEKLRDAARTWTDDVISVEQASAGRLTNPQRRLVPGLEYDLRALRDRALLLLMAAGSVRRAEAVRLDVTDVVPGKHIAPGEEASEKEALRVGIRKKNGMPKRALIAEREEEPAYCTARAVGAWILAAGLEEGPLFRSFGSHENLKAERISLSSVNYLLGQRAEAAGLDRGDWSPTRLQETP